MNFLQWITHTGLIRTDKYQKRRGVIIANSMSLILCGVILLSYALRYFVFSEVGNAPPLKFLFVGLFFCSAPLVLNRSSLTTASRLFLCYGTVVFIWVSFLLRMRAEVEPIPTSVYDTLRIYLLAVSIIPYLLFDRAKIYHLVLAVLPTFFSLLLFDNIMGWAGVSNSLVGAFADDYKVMQLRSMIAYLIISGGCYAFQSIIIQNDEMNQKLIKELKEKTEEIEMQNEELIQGQEKLNETNQHLEAEVSKKTENIKLQNMALINYAFANAHHVRGPLARILGLLQLTKIDKDLDQAWVFKQLEEETNQIDFVVKQIAKDLNEVDFLADGKDSIS